MPQSWTAVHRLTAVCLTLLVSLVLSSQLVAVRTTDVAFAQAPQNNVVSSLERYGQGDFDAAVQQLLGGKNVRSVLGDFRKQADAWIKAATDTDRPQRISLTGAMSAELFAATFSQHRDEYRETRSLMEWACERFRRLEPSEVERWFHLSTIALAQGVDDKVFIDGYGVENKLGEHYKHPGARFPYEPRFALAVATANPEANMVATWPVPPGYLVTGRPSMEADQDKQLIASSLHMLSQLFDNPAVRAEARLRSGVLRFLQDDVAAAQTDVTHAEKAQDPAVRSVANLMLGAVADRKGDDSEALRHYWLAYESAPSATSSIALASRLYRSGALDDAANVLRVFDAVTPVPDPWELYGQRDFRSFSALRHEMRRAVAAMMKRPIPPALPAIARPATFTMSPARPAAGDVRVAVLVQSNGEPVPDLKPEDFSLVDSGVPQQIIGVESETKALDVTVVAKEVTTVRSGKERTLDAEIAAVGKALTAADRLTVMLTGRDPRPFTPPGSRDVVKEAELERHCEPVYDTLARALMKPAAPDRQRVVIVVSTSEGSGGFLSNGPAAEIARRANARVYVSRIEPDYTRSYIAQAVCPAVGMDFSKDRQDRLWSATKGGNLQAFGNDGMTRLAAIAASTGGREIRPEVFRESAIGPLRDVFEEIRASYVLRYTPKGVPENGWHPITVKLNKPGRYDIRVRPGFER